MAVAITVPSVPNTLPQPDRTSIGGWAALIRSPLILGLGLILAVFLCYIPAISAGFVWDDDLLVTQNPLVHNADSLPYIWASAATTDYTPLTTTAFWLQWHLWGENPAGYHLVNILLHALSALLLWQVLARLKIPGAWLGAILFAVHPVNVASVAWIAELKNSLSLPFYLASIIATLRYAETRKLSSCLLAIAAAACAFLSKGSTVVLPLILLLCLWWKNARGAAWATVAPVSLLAALAACVTIHFQKRIIDPGADPFSIAARFARAGQALWFYLAKDLWPAHFVPIYPKWPIDHTFLALLLAVALTAFFWFGQRRFGRAPFFAWACFVVPLLPVLGVIGMSFLDQAWAADWWQQLALPAVAACAGAIIATLWQRVHRQPLKIGLSAITICVVLLLGAHTWADAAAYRNIETLSRRALAANPDAWAAHNNLGNVFSAQGLLQNAAAEYREALTIKPDNSSAHSNLGVILAREGRINDAISEYRAALAIEPHSANGWFNLANALRASGRNAEALDAFSKTIDEDARWIQPRYEMGSLLLRLGQPAQAGRQAEVIVHLDPKSVSGHYLMGRAAAGIGRFDVGTAEMHTALDLAGQGADADTVVWIKMGLQACVDGRKPPAPPPNH
jgi:protein O-mannosyl-transferase